MNPLLEMSSTLYLKRLAREVNGTPDGVYWNGTRCNHARFIQGRFELRACAGKWFAPTCVEIITDAYGRTVCASRVA